MKTIQFLAIIISIAAICSRSVGPDKDIRVEKMDPVEPEATEYVLIEQMDGIVDSVGDQNQDIGSKASFSNQSITDEPIVKPAFTTPYIPSILIGVYSGLTTGVSMEFVLGAILKLNNLPHDHFSPHNDFSSRQVLALTMTWMGSCGVTIPFWGVLSLWIAPKHVAVFGAVLNSAGLILLGPLPFQKTFTTIIIGMVLHGTSEVASLVGVIAYDTVPGSLFFAMFLGIKVGEALFSSGSITFASAINIIIFMKLVSIALISF